MNRLLRIAGVAMALAIILTILRSTGCGCGPTLEHLGVDFEPGRDGYAFDNPIDVTTGNDRDVWRRVFGDTDASRKNYDDMTSGGSNLFGGGVCYGMSGTSLDIFGGWAKAADFDQSPVAENTHGVRADMRNGDFDTAPPTVRDYIERYQLAQFTEGVRNSVVWDAPRAYAIMREALKKGGRGMVILRVRTKSQHHGKPAGHAIVPAAIDGPDNKGWVTISVWDNNSHDKVRKMKLNTKTWEWSYEFSFGETWSSKSGYFGVSRISDVVVAMDGSPGGSGVKAKSGDFVPKGGSAMVPLTVVSGADAVFRGGGGWSLSYVKGRLHDNLPGAEFVYPGVLGPPPRTATFIVPAGAEIARTVTATSAQPYRYAVLTPQGSALVTGRPGRRKTDSLEVGRGVTSVALTPRKRETAGSVSLSRFAGEQVRVMTVEPSGLRARETFKVAAADRDQAVQVTNEGRARTYRVTLSRYGASGSFQSAPLPIGAGETQTVKAYDWGNVGTSQVELFKGAVGASGGAGGTVLRKGTRASGAFPWVIVGIAAGVAAVVLAGLGVALWLRRRRAA
ncbi:MAG TPA: hypothetical protein VIL79_01305 [Thermoleophilia bacterium]